MRVEFETLKRSLEEVVPGTALPPARGPRAVTPPVVSTPAPATTPPEHPSPSRGGAGPSYRGPRAPTQPAQTPVRGGGVAAAGLDLSKLAPGRHGHILCTHTLYTKRQAQLCQKCSARTLCC